LRRPGRGEPPNVIFRVSDPFKVTLLAAVVRRLLATLRR
jgi:hypothetical protein